MDCCPHDFTDQEVAVAADGFCPLCAQAEMARMRKALEWYANTANYKAKMSDPVSSSGQHRACPVEKDYGETARAALSAAK